MNCANTHTHTRRKRRRRRERVRDLRFAGRPIVNASRHTTDTHTAVLRRTLTLTRLLQFSCSALSFSCLASGAAASHRLAHRCRPIRTRSTFAVAVVVVTQQLATWHIVIMLVHSVAAGGRFIFHWFRLKCERVQVCVCVWRLSGCDRTHTLTSIYGGRVYLEINLQQKYGKELVRRDTQEVTLTALLLRFGVLNFAALSRKYANRLRHTRRTGVVVLEKMLHRRFHDTSSESHTHTRARTR